MRRRLWKAAKILLGTILLVGTLLVVLLCVERLRGSIPLARYKRALAAQGEAVTAKDLVRPAPEGTNGAPVVSQASHELVKGPVLPNHVPPRMKLTKSGRAIVGFRQGQWSEEKATYDWTQLTDDLRSNEAVLKRIRSALQAPVLDNQLDYSGGPKMRFPQLITAKNLTYWFGSSCQLALHENRLQDGLDWLIPEIDLPRFLERDGILISELVRVALAAIARTDTWEALQAQGWTDDELLRIQKAWEDQRFLANFTRSLEGERVFATTTFDRCRASNQETASLLFWMEDFAPNDSERPYWENFLRGLPGGDELVEFLKKQVYCRVWRFAWLDQCELRYLKGVQQLVEVSRSAEQTFSAPRARTQNDLVMDRARNRNFYEELKFSFWASSVGTVSRAINTAMRAETERSLVLAAIALKRYELQNTNPPSSLDLLVPRFLAAMPMDYMDGKPIKFAVRADGTTELYSVGEDGVDDHGSSELRGSPGATGLWARKDFVWPEAAGPDE
jgi:hypothetical protein